MVGIRKEKKKNALRTVREGRQSMNNIMQVHRNTRELELLILQDRPASEDISNLCHSGD